MSWQTLTSAKLDARSIELRKTIIKMLDAAKRGHLGAAFSLVEILRVLYDDVLRYDARNPNWPDRDRFILSKGHGCLALYTILQEKGFFPEEELWKFCKADGMLGGHPEHKIPGVEFSTGSLGHGLPIGIGFALNAKHEKKAYRVFVVIGDGESNEGSIWEAALCAGKHKLDNLTVIVDYNKHATYGPLTELQPLEPFREKWKSFGFATVEVDGHSVKDLRRVLGSLPLERHKPTVIIAHTIKGRGVHFTENNMGWHHKSRISDEEIQELLTALK